MARSTDSRDEDVQSRLGDAVEPRNVSLEEVLRSYEQPINEEQAWALSFQCCRHLADMHPPVATQVLELSAILVHRDGSVSLVPNTTPQDEADCFSWNPERRLVQSLGVAIYRALDWGLNDSEERELNPQLECLIEGMAGGDGDRDLDCYPGNSTSDEGYSGQEEEDEDNSGFRLVSTFRQVMMICASRLVDPTLAADHYQAVCRALFVETLELQTFLAKIKDAKEMLKKITKEETVEESELDSLKHKDWARLWVQLMKELRQGVKLKKVHEQPFNPLPTEFSLTPFEMLMQDIRACNFQLRKVMLDGDIPTRIKRNAHEVILDFIRSRPPLKPVAERSLAPPPPQQQSLHEQVLAEIKQERKLRPVVLPRSRPFGSMPCLAQTCPCSSKSTSCIDLSISETGSRSQVPSRPRILLKAPTLAEMEEMNVSEEEESPDTSELRRTESSPTPLKRDRSFSEHDLALLRSEILPSLSESGHFGDTVALNGGRPRSRTLTGPELPPKQRAFFPLDDSMSSSPARLSLSSVDEASEGYEKMLKCRSDKHQWMEEFSHPVESLALTVEEVINVRRVLVKAEMEKFLQTKELYNNLKKGKVCCCCRVKFPLFSWPSSCLLCKRPACAACSAKMKIPCKKMAHIPVYTVGFHSAPKNHQHRSKVYKSLCNLSRCSVEEEFPHLRRSLDLLNNTPKREAKTLQGLSIPPTVFVDQLHRTCTYSILYIHEQTVYLLRWR
ncbi:protein spire homolog 2 isoform X2 [Nerophis ophidion]|uniref:protein spire homolog 2 isoform X2 n=1 Tax=Nerophis ophidion TaxID=159077 RepID=UPI002ADF53F5|nr:protein spire homolog 2 isoform X2 [Nerophis ophidion]